MSRKRRWGRLPTSVMPGEFEELKALPSSALASRRADAGSLMHFHGAVVNRLRTEAEAITTILHERERPEFEVSDHAVVRWLEKVKGQDVDALRREIAAACMEARSANGAQVCRAKGDAVAYTKGDLTFVVAHRNNIVTVVAGDYVMGTGKRTDEAVAREARESQTGVGSERSSFPD